jgi:hypothetical protein
MARIDRRKYWLVGASNGVDEDYTDGFIQKGVWRIFWDIGDVPKYDKKLNQMKIGDAIAIKQMLGQGSGDILIKAFGRIKGIDLDTRSVYVDWIETNLSRKVESKGAFGSLHGPYRKDAEKGNWVRRIFSL